MKWILMLCLLVELPFLVIVLYDIISDFIHNLRRYHIGRWNSEKEWEKAVKACARKWLLNPPVVSPIDKQKYRLYEIIKGNTKNDTIQSWQQAGLVLGILSCNETKDNAVLDKWQQEFVDKDGNWKKQLKKVDWAMLGYAIIKQSKCPNDLKSVADQVLRMLQDNLCSDGMISYSQGKNSTTRYVDTLGMVCPFLALYGRVYKEPDVASLAVNQIELFRKNGLLGKTNLPCHAYDSDKRMPLGIFGWGRGTAWYIIALVDTWKELPEGIEKEKLEKWMKDAADEYLKYQKKDGAFFTILQGSGQYDSSVTAAMAYFYSVCADLFMNEEYKMVSLKCKRRLMQVTMRDGAIDQCQGDTHGIGCFSQNYDIMPFVQGLVIRSM